MSYTPRLFLILLWFIGLAACSPGAATSSSDAPVISNWSGPTPTRAVGPNPAAGRTVELPPSPTPVPSATPIPQPWRFVVLGDTRTEGLRPPDITYAIVERARQAQPEVVLCVGDMINALDSQDDVRAQWRFWNEAIAPLGMRYLLITPGNHDVQQNAWATELLAEAFPKLPSDGPAGFERRAYVFDYRDVRFISLDSEQFDQPNRLGPEQLSWLEQQLRNNPNRYTIVFSHAPAYPVGPHIGSSLDVYPQERDQFWQLLRDHKVTAYITGHEHLYNHQQIAEVQQIIVGTSGSGIYGGYGGEFYHYLVAEVGAETLTLTIYDQDGQERDSFTLR